MITKRQVYIKMRKFINESLPNRRVWMGGGGGGFKCKLSVKILAICQLSVNFWAIYQLSVNWLLIINYAS